MNPSLTDPNPLLCEIYAAKLLAVSSRTLQAWRRKEYGPPFVRVGRAIRYRQADVLEWIEAQVCRASVRKVASGNHLDGVAD
jgi:excisionase family DNA binding protein